MAVFEANNLTVTTHFLEDKVQGGILEIEFKGIHTHHWPAGGNPSDFIKNEVKNARPAGLLFNFLGYHYEFGDEVGGAVISAGLALGTQLIKHWAIVAKGTTARCLHSLIAPAMLDKIFNYAFFEDLEAGRAFLRRVLEEDPGKRGGLTEP